VLRRRLAGGPADVDHVLHSYRAYVVRRSLPEASISLIAAAMIGCGRLRGTRRTYESSCASALLGSVAGAAGTAALNVATYADMAVARPSPRATRRPALVQDRRDLGRNRGALGRRSDRGEPPQRGRRAARLRERARARRGLRGHPAPGCARGSRVPLAGLVIGAAAMAMSDVPATRAGITDPRTWGTAGWLADIVPHALFGLDARRHVRERSTQDRNGLSPRAAKPRAVPEEKGAQERRRALVLQQERLAEERLQNEEARRARNPAHEHGA
jgi:hypothetical protein